MKQLLYVVLLLGCSVQAGAMEFSIDRIVGIVRGIVKDDNISKVEEIQQVTDGEGQGSISITINTHPFDEAYYERLNQLAVDLENAEAALKMTFGIVSEAHHIARNPQEDREQARAARREIISQLEEAKIDYQNILLADPNASEQSIEQARLIFHRVWDEARRIQDNLQRAQDSYGRAVDNVHKARDAVKEAQENVSQAVEACYNGFRGS